MANLAVKFPKTLTRIEISGSRCGKGITATIEVHSTRDELEPRQTAKEHRRHAPVDRLRPMTGISRPGRLPRNPTELARLESEGLSS